MRTLLVLLVLSIASPAWGASYSDRIEEAFGIGNIEDGTAQWSRDELRILAASLASLTKAERRGVRGVRVVRMRRAGRRAGLYKDDGQSPAIHVFDLAFDGPGRGSARTPNHTLMHEFGHAISHKAVRVATRKSQRRVDELNRKVDAYNGAVRDYNALIRRWNATQDAAARREIAPLRRRVERLGKEIAEGRDEVRTDNRIVRALASDYKAPIPRWGVLQDYKSVIGLKIGPTPYGRSNIRESFAESFQLYKVDRESLKSWSPRLVKWFAREGHLNPTR